MDNQSFRTANTSLSLLDQSTRTATASLSLLDQSTSTATTSLSLLDQSTCTAITGLSLLLLSPLKQMSGNYSTAVRLRGHFQSAGISCFMEETTRFSDSEMFQDYIREHKVQFVISLHTYHSGVMLVGCPIPYIVILGGTDVHEYSKDPRKYELMRTVLQRASKIIAFGKSLVMEVFKKWTEFTWSDVCIIPQAVSTSPSAFSIQMFLRTAEDVSGGEQTGAHSAHRRIFLVVGGIRPVKHPLFLMKTFSDWHVNNQPSAYLAFLGPLIDEIYGVRFTQEVKRCPGVVYIPGVTIQDTHAAIRDSTALVNSSKSEGMASAILEAMDMGTPVIARDIAANRDLIEHGETGLLFHTPQDFIKMAEKLLTSPDLRTHLTRRAKEQITNQHSLSVEQEAYLSLIGQLMYSRNKEVKHIVTKK